MVLGVDASVEAVELSGVVVEAVELSGEESVVEGRTVAEFWILSFVVELGRIVEVNALVAFVLVDLCSSKLELVS